MADQAVVNASPLICLSRAGLVDLLRQAAQTIIVPAAVAREILARGPRDVTATPERQPSLMTPMGAVARSPWASPCAAPWVSSCAPVAPG